MGSDGPWSSCSLHSTPQQQEIPGRKLGIRCRSYDRRLVLVAPRPRDRNFRGANGKIRVRSRCRRVRLWCRFRGSVRSTDPKLRENGLFRCRLSDKQRHGRYADHDTQGRRS
ncbi:hypothetical protein L596_007399 [Steinernema carpocapsae]|uniref:Uncharacterized protein n=1 Tax=Steinernema carpocapsae TaxID=34508 RepID=A0A4U5P9B5_STECR|nr:hypothetical protein L596_007399 [Steinernema carpocapsae]